MPRAATSTDIFAAIAEPRRREILELLAKRGPHPVGSLVALLGLPQPAVSKHLGVLRAVGLVSVVKSGQHRVYRLEADELKTVLDWTKAFEQFWSSQLDRIKQRAERESERRRTGGSHARGA